MHGVMPRSAPALALAEADHQQLRHWVLAFGTPQPVDLRSQIVLAAAAGQSDNAIAQQLEVKSQDGQVVAYPLHPGGPG
jgi:hypothetical protein